MERLAQEKYDRMMRTLQRQFSRLFKSSAPRTPHKRKAQSLVEFAITLPILLLFLSGVVEFGFALNYYLSLLDATRESARFFSNGSPFKDDNSDDMDFYSAAAAMTRAALDPFVVDSSYVGRRIPLDPNTDDIVITVYSRSSGAAVAHPSGGVYRMYGHATSLFTPARIQAAFGEDSPNAGILVVEVHYNYHQVMKLPWLAPFLPDPLMLRAYTIMPLSAAEPVVTPTP
ncbi:MAG: hypothetical protein B6D38_11525 [Anaerolineae bacterium UTCFX1]|jgi:hypothetical protein|nr:MAG: hypothetical protein B6D38_11525 [Anaerolineae bacterium UTCFX1]